MANRDKLRKRQIIWAEYESGSNEEQAHAKFGSGTVSKKTIDRFYRRFNSKDISLFNKNSSQHGIIHTFKKLPNGEEVRGFKNDYINV
jgi:transposase